jgi:hypothetical protein
VTFDVMLSRCLKMANAFHDGFGVAMDAGAEHAHAPLSHWQHNLPRHALEQDQVHRVELPDRIG